MQAQHQQAFHAVAYGSSSSEPDDSGRKVNPSQECRCRFVIARGNAPVLLQPRKEVLNEMPLLVDMAVIPALSFVRPNTGNDNLRTCLRSRHL